MNRPGPTQISEKSDQILKGNHVKENETENEMKELFSDPKLENLTAQHEQMHRLLGELAPLVQFMDQSLRDTVEMVRIQHQQINELQKLILSQQDVVKTLVERSILTDELAKSVTELASKFANRPPASAAGLN
jgi:ABC-type transporter Mla subunit MlaD